MGSYESPDTPITLLFYGTSVGEGVIEKSRNGTRIRHTYLPVLRGLHSSRQNHFESNVSLLRGLSLYKLCTQHFWAILYKEEPYIAPLATT